MLHINQTCAWFLGVCATIAALGPNCLAQQPRGASSPAVANSIQIDNLRPNQRLTNSLYAVSGRARKNPVIRDVRFRLNGGEWVNALGTTSWVAPIRLRPGTNLFEVFETDKMGIPSLPTGINCFLAVPAELKLETTGWGSISRIGFTGNRLEVGRSYRVYAIPAPGQVFSGWEGGISATNNPLIFTMESNLVLRAMFETNQFQAIAGTYNGLFYPSDDQGGITGAADATNSGFVSVRVMSNARFSGKVALEGVAQPIQGMFGTDFTAQAIVPQNNGEPLTVSMELDPDSQMITGTVARNDQWSSSLLARKGITGSTNAFVGNYTLLIEGCDTGGCFVGPPVPLGDCPLTVKMTRSGSVQAVGTMADGVLFSEATQVSEDGYWPLYAPLYRGRGLLIGWPSLAEGSGVAIVLWQKPATGPSDEYYPDGFSSSRVALISPYQAPPPTQNALGWTNGIVVLGGGDMPAMLTNRIQVIGNQVRDLGGSISNLNLSIKPNDGAFSGSFTHPETHRMHSFKGTVVQSSPYYFTVSSGGWFLGTNTAGIIRLHPQE